MSSGSSHTTPLPLTQPSSDRRDGVFRPGGDVTVLSGTLHNEEEEASSLAQDTDR